MATGAQKLPVELWMLVIQQLGWEVRHPPLINSGPNPC